MAYLLPVLLTLLALLGHAALWVSFINRLNAIPLHYLVLRWINRPAMVLCGLIALAMIGWAVFIWWPVAMDLTAARGFAPSSRLTQLAGYYFLICWAMAVWAIVVWTYRCIAHRRWSGIRIVHSELINVAQEGSEKLAHGLKARLCSRLPGNQIFQMEVRTVELVLPRLPPVLDGFSIVHLSDFHLAGHVGKPFFDETIRQANSLDADVILITGDIIDKPRCLPWIAEFGKLQSRHGVYFVLGNHDYRVCPVDELRAKLEEFGLKNLGGGHHLFTCKDVPVLLAGNELPWHREPPELDQLPANPHSARLLSIALAHTPDEVDWARELGFDLLLAGHLHGGQIRLPIIGPVLSPSRHGVRFSGGTFYLAPTVMHVTRGLCGMMPLRFNCPPEVTKFVLRAE